MGGGGMSKKGLLKPHTAKLLQLFDAGERDFGILAAECGMSRSAVRQALNWHKRGGSKNLRDVRWQNSKCITLWIPQAFVDEAKRRGKSCNRLAYELIRVIAKDNLFNGVLDDAEAA
jgi:hypothetical protein